ncbi:MAG: fumarylacetoacetase [Steroidobacterales bacterium]
MAITAQELLFRSGRRLVTAALNATHDARARSWIAAANDPLCDFPIQNLPFGVFRRLGSDEAFRGGVAIGEQIVDLDALGAIVPDSAAAPALRTAGQSTLNALMQSGPGAWHALRGSLFEMLREHSTGRSLVEPCLVPQASAEFALPAQIGDYTDFYASKHHALAVGKLFRPDNPLTPNYLWMPIAYHGRASSIGVSEQLVHRPSGQTLPPGATRPLFGASRRLDYELEVGIFIGTGNALGTTIGVDAAEDHVFGLCLLNDWSARDVQRWEAQPLGPFLGKNFATTISPWIVTLEALAPFRAPLKRDAADEPSLPYLESAATRAAGGFDVELSVYLETAAMRARNRGPERLARSNFRHAHWTLAQMLAHHTVGGCNLRCGDLLGSGTLSGPLPEEAGSLLELTGGGAHDITLSSGEKRTFLEDGDRVILRGRCVRAGFAAIGFGEATGRILPA